MAEAEINPTIQALYAKTNAALNFSLQNTLAQGNLSKKFANQNFDYVRGNAVRQQPQRFQAIRNQANSQGLAESGVLAQTTQRQAANNVQQLGGLAQQRAQAVERINKGEFSAIEGNRIGKEQNLAKRGVEQLDYDIANPKPVSTPSTPNGVAPSPTSNLPAGYTAKTQKGGSVSISPPGPPIVTGGYPQPLSAPRKKAAKKAVG